MRSERWWGSLHWFEPFAVAYLCRLLCCVCALVTRHRHTLLAVGVCRAHLRIRHSIGQNVISHAPGSSIHPVRARSSAATSMGNGILCLCARTRKIERCGKTNVTMPAKREKKTQTILLGGNDSCAHVYYHSTRVSVVRRVCACGKAE